MNKPVKLPEIRKEAFTKARETLGLSTKDLSGMACLSVRQIEQIENGESSSFYGPQVKVTAAKKVAGLLKLNEADAFDFGELAPTKKSESTNAVEETKTSAEESASSKVVKKEKKSKPEKSAEIKTVEQKAVPEASTSTVELAKPFIPSQDLGNLSTAKDSKKKLGFIVLIAAALVFSIVNLRPLFFPEAVKEEVVVVEETAPASPPAEAVAEAKPAPELAPPVAAVASATSSDCPPADPGVSYKVEGPKKAGDMVYLQSKTAQTVCIVDASGKTQNKALEPGVGASIYGKPPLKVLTSGQVPVDMFYQGVKVRLSNITAKTIILEPVEMNQPLAPSDSQLR